LTGSAADLAEVLGGIRFMTVAENLAFPEGPVALDDGSVVLVEMFGPRITRVWPDGRTEVVAEIPGGPNGAALGPDGSLLVCNNGGAFAPLRINDLWVPGPFDPARYLGGSLQHVDLETGQVSTVLTEVEQRRLRAPNDLVVDAAGGVYLTDHGIRDHEKRTSDLTAIVYVPGDGSPAYEVVFPVEAPNGIGLSLDGSELYWAETHTARVMRRRISSPGVLEPVSPGDTSVVLDRMSGPRLLDSLAVDAAGRVCVATLVVGGISVVAPSGGLVGFVPVDDRITTNVCFDPGDPTTVWVTAASTGRLLRNDPATPWPL
jgi:gluconolactonase